MIFLYSFFDGWEDGIQVAMHFLRNPHWLEDVLALQEDLVNSFEGKSPRLRKAKVNAYNSHEVSKLSSPGRPILTRKHEQQIQHGPDNIEFPPNRGIPYRRNLDSHEIKRPLHRRRDRCNGHPQTQRRNLRRIQKRDPHEPHGEETTIQENTETGESLGDLIVGEGLTAGHERGATSHPENGDEHERSATVAVDCQDTNGGHKGTEGEDGSSEYAGLDCGDADLEEDCCFVVTEGVNAADLLEDLGKAA